MIEVLLNIARLLIGAIVCTVFGLVILCVILWEEKEHGNSK